MKIHRLSERAHLAVMATLAAIASAACSISEQSQTFVSESASTLDVPSDSLAGVTDVVVSEHREIFLLDYRRSRIVVLDSLGHTLRAFGREGSGPGELRYPDTMLLSGDTLFVANRPNGRLEIFSTAGIHIGARRLPSRAVGSVMSYLPNGTYLASTGGAHNALALMLRDSTELFALGEPVPGAHLPWDSEDLKMRIARGEIPPELQNAVRPILLEDGSSWLVIGARGAIQRFDSAGRYQWEHVVQTHVLDSAKAQFFRDNRNERNPSRLHMLTTFVKARGVGSSLWVAPKETGLEGIDFAILEAGLDAPLRLRVPNVINLNTFFVDAPRNALYLLETEPPRLSVVQIPPAVMNILRQRP